MQPKQRAIAMTVGLFLVAASGPAVAQPAESDRRRKGEDTIRTLNAGRDQPTLEGLRREFPFLAGAITDYALGDVWARPGLDHRTRQLAAVSAFAALGHRPFLKIHAGYALNLGVAREELKEVVYLTTVHAGFPRAIEAAQTLMELFQERDQQAGAQTVQNQPATIPHKYVGMWVTEDGRIRHELLPNGRYDEARGDRRSAYRGRYEVRGNHIDYWDDTGFTADGTFVSDDALHHGGMVFRRQR